MLREIYLHYYQSLVRSPSFEGNLTLKIIKGLGVLSLLVAWGVFAYHLPEFFKTVFSDHLSLEEIFGRFFLFYVVLDLVLRLFFQPLPTVKYPHYALLPINKDRLFFSLLLSSLFNAFNLAGILLVFSLGFRYIIPELGVSMGVLWILGLLAAILFTHYFSLWLKARIQFSTKAILALFGAAALFFGLVTLNVFKPTELSFLLFGDNLLLGYSFVLFAGLAVLSWSLAYWDLQKSIYSFTTENYPLRLQGLSLIRKSGDGVVRMLFLKNLYSIFRHSKLVLLSIVILLSAASFLYSNHLTMSLDGSFSEYFMLFNSYFIFGFWHLLYGGRLSGWDSAYFDGLSVLPFSIEDHIKAKWLILALPATLIYLLAFPLVAFYWGHLLKWTAAWLVVCGPLSLMVIAISAFDRSHFDPGKGGWFDQQESEGMSMILNLLAFILLGAIAIPFGLMDDLRIGAMIWIALGIIVLITHSFWIRKTAVLFKRQKYNMMESFRKKSQ